MAKSINKPAKKAAHKKSASGMASKSKPVAKKAKAQLASKSGKPVKKMAIKKVAIKKLAKPVKKPVMKAKIKPKPKPVLKTVKKKSTKLAKVATRTIKPSVKSKAKPTPVMKSVRSTVVEVPKSRPAAPTVKSPSSAPIAAKKELVKSTIKQMQSGKKGKMGVVDKAAGGDSGISMEDGRYALPSGTHIELPKEYKPSPNEEYMNPSQLEYFRRKLLKWRDDLVEESKQTIDNLREEVRDVGDDAERATRETENSLELRTRDRYRKLIAKIDKAVKRIEDGRYGYCEETDEEIGIDRLEARPIATLCLDAQERWEHRQKQMGD